MANDSIPQKRCTKCKQYFPATTEHFNRDKRFSSGLYSRCKSCVNEYQRDRYANIPELRTRILQHKQERRKDPEIREQINQRHRESLQDPEVRERYKRQKNEHRRDPEVKKRRNQHSRERYANDPEYRNRINVKIKQRSETEHGKVIMKVSASRRRARKRDAEGFYTTADVELQYKAQKGKCWHCGKSLNGKFHIDHLKPLAKGGTNWPNNIVCSCAKCNQSKNDKLCHEWNGKLF